MIKNERQYRITKYQADKFTKALEELGASEKAGGSSERHPLIRKAERDALESQLSDLKSEIQEFEELKTSPPPMFELRSIEELPNTLIKARIALGLSQKNLAERLNIPEQVIQRYEASDYESASVARINEIIKALKIVVGESVRLPDSEISLRDFFRKMSEAGLDRRFIEDRLLPRALAARIHNQGATSDLLGLQAAAYIGRVYGWKPDQILGPEPLTVNPELLGKVRFKVSSRTRQPKLNAFTVYARHISLLVEQATRGLPRSSLPTNPHDVRKDLLSRFGSITFGSLVRYAWGLGVPVIVLDPGSFHAACLQTKNGATIVLTQKISSEARWMFNLMHEFCHAANNEEIIDESEEQLRGSDEERIASQFADVVLTGKNPVYLHELAARCLEEANWDEYLFKSVIQKIASEEGVRVDVLANYLAYRLSAELGKNWWPTAESLQKQLPNSREIVRDIMLEHTDFAVLPPPDLELLRQAFDSREVTVNG